MGWNTISTLRPSTLLHGLDGADVYFAHSFAVDPDEDGVTVAVVDHDGPLVAAVESGPIAGVQFHPERSAAAGARLLDNLVRWSRNA
jgi:glutamine amidotransferase